MALWGLGDQLDCGKKPEAEVCATSGFTFGWCCSPTQGTQKKKNELRDNEFDFSAFEFEVTGRPADIFQQEIVKEQTNQPTQLLRHIQGSLSAGKAAGTMVHLWQFSKSMYTLVRK